jgi:putative transposase
VARALPASSLARPVRRTLIHFRVRHGDQADSTVILTALSVDMAGNKEVLALRARAEEGKDGWVSVLEDLRRRGATQLDLIVTDWHDGLVAAVTDLFPAKKGH